MKRRRILAGLFGLGVSGRIIYSTLTEGPVREQIENSSVSVSQKDIKTGNSTVTASAVVNNNIDTNIKVRIKFIPTGSSGSKTTSISLDGDNSTVVSVQWDLVYEPSVKNSEISVKVDKVKSKEDLI